MTEVPQREHEAWWENYGKKRESIAATLLHVSKGDMRKLRSKDFKNPNSIWGAGVRHLFEKDQSTEVERLVLHRIWLFNRKNIRVIYNELRLKSGTRPPPPPAYNEDDAGYLGCICEPRYTRLDEDARICCDRCNHWLHPGCISIDINKYGVDDEFICGICLGQVQIPAILEKTLDSSVSTSENQENGTDKNQLVTAKSKSRVSNNSSSSKPANSDKSLSKMLTRSKTKLKQKQIHHIKHSETRFESKENDDWVDFDSEDNPDERKISPKRRSSPRKKKSPPVNEISKICPARQSPAEIQKTNKKTYDTDDEDQQLAKILSSQENAESGTDDDDNDSGTLDNAKNVKFATTGPVFMSPKTRYSSSDSDAETDGELKGPEDDQKADKKKEFLDDAGEEKKFSIMLTPEEYKSFITWIPKTSGKEACHYTTRPKVHGPILRAHFDQINKSCNVVFSKKELVDPCGTSKPFWRCYGLCKRDVCTARWKFTIQRAPFSHVEHVPVMVEFHDGVIKHSRGEKSYVRKAGKDLQESKEAVRHNKPAATFTKKFASADMGAILRGKYNSVGTLKSLSRIRDKVRAEDDLHPETVFDLALTSHKLRNDFPDTVIPGYVQSLNVMPFKITLFTKRQFKILNSMQKHGYGKSLLIDATSGLVNNIGQPFDDGKVLSYTIIAPSPLKGATPMPIAEFLSSDGTGLSLYHFLNTVFSKYNEVFSIKDRRSNLLKFECDFSKPLLISIIKQFTGLKLEQYLNAYWTHFNSEESEKENLDLFLVHVCRFHIMKTLKKTFKKMFPDKNQFRILSTWAELLVRTKTMRHWDQRLKDIAMLFSYDVETDSITKIIEYLSGNGDSPNAASWRRFSTDHFDPKGPFYLRSFFGLHAHHVFQVCEEENVRILSTTKNTKKNRFRSKDAASYIRVHIAPFGPVISRMCYEATGMKVSDDTTNLMEGFHSIQKNNLYENITNLRSSRYIRKQAEYIKGICNRTEAALEIKVGNSQTYAEPKSKPSETSDHKRSSNKTRNSVRKIKNMFRASTPNKSTKQTAETPTSSKPGLKTSDRQNTPDKSDTWSGSIVDHQGATQHCVDSSNSNEEEINWSRTIKPIGTAKKLEHLSPEKEKEGFKSTPNQKKDSACKNFMASMPNVSYGGIHKPTNIRLRNTCSLDTSLTILTALCLSDGAVPNYIARFSARLNAKAANEADKPTAKRMSTIASRLQCMLDIVDMVEAGEFSDAKSRWIDRIQQLDVRQVSGDLLNSESETAFKYIAELFPLTVQLRCTDFDSTDGTKHRKQEYDGNIFNIAKPTPHAFLSAINYGYTHDSYCTCGELLKTTYNLKFSQAPFLFYTMIHNRTYMYGEDVLPISQQIRGEPYTVFAYTIRSGPLDSNDAGTAHYIAKFPMEGKLLVYDGMCAPFIQRKHNPNHYVTSVWLKKAE